MRDSLYAPSAQPDVNGHSQPRPAWPVICWFLITGPTVSTPSFHTPPFPPFPVNLPRSIPFPLLYRRPSPPLGVAHRTRTRRTSRQRRQALRRPLARSVPANPLARVRGPTGGRGGKNPSPGAGGPQGEASAWPFPHLLAAFIYFLRAFLGPRSRGEMRALRGSCECEQEEVFLGGFLPFAVLVFYGRYDGFPSGL